MKNCRLPAVKSLQREMFSMVDKQLYACKAMPDFHQMRTMAALVSMPILLSVVNNIESFK